MRDIRKGLGAVLGLVLSAAQVVTPPVLFSYSYDARATVPAPSPSSSPGPQVNSADPHLINDYMKHGDEIQNFCDGTEVHKSGKPDVNSMADQACRDAKIKSNGAYAAMGLAAGYAAASAVCYAACGKQSASVAADAKTAACGPELQAAGETLQTSQTTQSGKADLIDDDVTGTLNAARSVVTSASSYESGMMPPQGGACCTAEGATSMGVKGTACTESYTRESAIRIPRVVTDSSSITSAMTAVELAQKAYLAAKSTMEELGRKLPKEAQRTGQTQVDTVKGCADPTPEAGGTSGYDQMAATSAATAAGAKAYSAAQMQFAAATTKLQTAIGVLDSALLSMKSTIASFTPTGANMACWEISSGALLGTLLTATESAIGLSTKSKALVAALSRLNEGAATSATGLVAVSNECAVWAQQALTLKRTQETWAKVCDAAGHTVMATDLTVNAIIKIAGASSDQRGTAATNELMGVAGTGLGAVLGGGKLANSCLGSSIAVGQSAGQAVTASGAPGGLAALGGLGSMIWGAICKSAPNKCHNACYEVPIGYSIAATVKTYTSMASWKGALKTVRDANDYRANNGEIVLAGATQVDGPAPIAKVSQASSNNDGKIGGVKDPTATRKDEVVEAPKLDSGKLASSAASAGFGPILNAMEKISGTPKEAYLDRIAKGESPNLAAAQAMSGSLDSTAAGLISGVNTHQKALSDALGDKVQGPTTLASDTGFESAGGRGSSSKGGGSDMPDLGALLGGLMPGAKGGGEQGPAGVQGVKFNPTGPKPATAGDNEGLLPPSKSLFDVVSDRYRYLSGPLLAGEDLMRSGKVGVPSSVPSNIYLKTKK
jgi:hypothetical protein